MFNDFLDVKWEHFKYICSNYLQLTYPDSKNFEKYVVHSLIEAYENDYLESRTGAWLVCTGLCLNMQICFLGLDSTLAEYHEWTDWKRFTRISITGAKQERDCCQFHASVRFNRLFYQSDFLSYPQSVYTGWILINCNERRSGNSKFSFVSPVWIRNPILIRNLNCTTAEYSKREMIGHLFIWGSASLVWHSDKSRQAF